MMCRERGPFVKQGPAGPGGVDNSPALAKEFFDKIKQKLTDFINNQQPEEDEQGNAESQKKHV